MNNHIKPQVLVAQVGSRMHYAVPTILHRAGMLAHFYTDAYAGPGSSWHRFAKVARLLPDHWRPASMKRFLGRREDVLPPEKVTAFNLLGLRYALLPHLIRNPEHQERCFLNHGRRFCQVILENSLPFADVVYAFQGVCLPIFIKARSSSGMATFLERVITPKAIQYELLTEESQCWPDWEPPYPDLAVWQPRIELEKEEWNLADAVICASSFVAKGLTSQGVLPEKIRIVPYGVDTARFSTLKVPWDGQRPLRLLFVGGVTLRKGVQYIDQALQKLKGLTLEMRFVGPLAIRDTPSRRMAEHYQLMGAVPRSEINRHYAWADLFVFPSICEGSATVIYEALAAGLPVITTPNAGSVVRNGLDGYIVPIRDSETIAEKIEILAKNPDLLAWMSHNAATQALEFSWEKYGERLTDAITSILGEPARYQANES